MAAQLVARFFKYFPEHENDAFNSIIDLCESADVDVRKHATMAMIAISRDCKQVVGKAADILIQLYQSNQASEVNLINQSLATLLNLDIESFLKIFFENFDDGSEQVRDRAIKFLSSKIHTIDESRMTKEVEEQLMNYTKKAMEDVTKDEFIAFVGILSKLKISKTSTGQATIVSAIKSQAEMDKDFDPNTLDKFLLCTRLTMPFLSQYNTASEYINFICLKILPHLKELNGEDLKVLQALAELSPNIISGDIPKLIDLDQCVQAVYSKLMEYLPMPPEVVDQPMAEQQPATASSEVKPDAGEAPAADSNGQAQEKPTEGSQPAQAEAANNPGGDQAKKPQDTDFQFTHIEYLMYTFVQLCRLNPALYTEAIQTESKKQLFYLSNGCKKYTDALERQLAGVKRQDLVLEENKLRSVALRTTKNISSMIVGLFKRPADFKTSIVLSCKPVKVEPPQAAPPAGDTNNNNNNRHNKQHHNNRGGHQHSNNHHHHNNNSRQPGQKNKFRGNYQSDYRGGNKRPRR